MQRHFGLHMMDNPFLKKYELLKLKASIAIYWLKCICQSILLTDSVFRLFRIYKKKSKQNIFLEQNSDVPKKIIEICDMKIFL